MSVPFVVTTMARRGLLRPGPPRRVLTQFRELHRWGFTLAGELRQAAARNPATVALIDERRGALTYARLRERCEKLALGLRSEAGLRPADRVGLLCRNSAEMVETLIAITLIGADPVLVNTGLSQPQLAAVIRDQGLKVLIHDDEFAVPGGLVLTELTEGGPGELTPPERPGRTVVLTSGTTGRPKGAQRPTPKGFSPLCSVIDRIPLRVGDRIMISAPLFHTWGYAGLQMALALRATIVLRRRFEPATALAAMIEHDCTAMIAVPVMLQGLMELPAPPRRPPLRVVAVSGSTLPGTLATRFMDRYGDVLYNMYGSTEVSMASIATPADMRAAPNTAGRPPHGTRIAVLDEDGRPVAAGTPGRLFIGNELLFEGYTNGTGLPARDGLLAIGDVGHLDPQGRVFIDGRQDDMIISGGENVFPSEVENLLADLPQVREVAVIGVPDPEYGQRLAAYLVLHPGGAADPDEIREHVRRHRARFCVPRDIVFLPALPRNATGKVLTRDLPR
jgi:acyl-CoA synthetase (AMP-forming)/AMP-acid ligase II